jgi:broad specificity phosphatase PhoE
LIRRAQGKPMSKLILVRHGQATMFTEDYDRLSPAGEAQSRRLGEFWLARGLRFDAVYSGPRQRQARTAELVGEQYARAGRPWPELVTLAELDEYDADGIMSRLLPALAERDERLRQLAASYEQVRHGPDRFRHFQKLFEVVTAAWLQGVIEMPGVESWRSFHDRVRRGLAHITSAAGSGQRIAAFTSGGPISVAAQLATKAPEMTALELNWRLRNCSLTEIVFTQDRFTLDSFNSLAHLEDPALWTYR